MVQRYLFDTNICIHIINRHLGFEQGQGTPIGAMDMLIAAHALTLGTVIVTHNAREFMRVPRLPVEKWLDR